MSISRQHVLAAGVALFEALNAFSGPPVLIKGEDGVVRRIFLPDEDAICWPLFPVEDDEEASLGERKPLPDEAGLRRMHVGELGGARQMCEKYGLVAYECDFAEGKWRCLLYSPRSSRSKALPLVVHIPGTGEIGDDLSRQFNQRGIFDVVISEQFQKRHPCHFLSLSPPRTILTFGTSAPGRPAPSVKHATAVVRSIMKLAVPQVDTNRVYVSGFSYGGDAAYMLAVGFPDTFAACVPISIGVPHPDFFPDEKPGNYWHVCNSDEAVYPEKARAREKEVSDLVNGRGGDFRVSVYPSCSGHNAWTSAWNEAEIWDWLFSKSIAPLQVKRPSIVGRSSVSLAYATATSSVAAADAAHGPERAIDFLQSTYFKPEKPFEKDDWWQVDLGSRMSGIVRIVSGDSSGYSRLASGYAEVSVNGKSWRRMGVFSERDGICEFRVHAPVRFVRVRSTQPASPFVIRLFTILK